MVAGAVLVLEVERGAQAAQPAAAHDGDDVAQGVGLLHRVRGEHDDPVLLGLLDDVPHAAPVDRVHARGGLVEVDHVRVGDEGAGHGEAAAHPARVLAARRVAPVREVDRSEEVLDEAGDLGRLHEREPGEEREVLVGGELRPEHVVLRADAHHALHLAQLVPHALAEDVRVALGGREHAREHVEGGRLARTIVAEQAEELIVLDAKVDLEDRRERCVAAFAAEALAQVDHTHGVVVAVAARGPPGTRGQRHLEALALGDAVGHGEVEGGALVHDLHRVAARLARRARDGHRHRAARCGQEAKDAVLLAQHLGRG